MIFNMHDSGNTLGFDVVNGLTAPASPDEGTVWFKASLDINDVYVADEAPASASEGDAWVRTLTGGPICKLWVPDGNTSTALNIYTLNIYTGGKWVDCGGGVQTITFGSDASTWVDMTYKVYGISRTVGDSSWIWSRTDYAQMFNATSSFGTTAGSSDFDSCYPWNGITRETLSSGDVMVKIPKFWYKRYIEDNVEYIKIADTAVTGYELHPAFFHSDVAKDYVYVAAYITSSGNKSVTNASPTVSQTRATMRTNAKAKGTGWGLIDVSTVSAVQMLMMVEFASSNLQYNIGYGYHYSVGNGYANTGTSDSVPNLTGAADYVTVVYRGIEDFWGNLEEFVDGINWSAGTYYVCNNPSNYADDTSSGYTALSFTGSISWSKSYITKEGLDTNKPHVILPEEAGSGSNSTYDCGFVSGGSGWRVATHGGYASDDYGCGPFTWYFGWSSSQAKARVSSRLMYIP